MPKSGKRKNRQGKGSRQRRNEARFQRLSQPYVAYVPYSTSVDVTFASVIPDTVFSGVPWRLLSCSAEATILNTKVSGKDSDVEYPGFLQVSINDAAISNVESLVSTRFLVTSSLVRSRRLTTPAPNNWKENEQRNQALVTLTNLTFGSGPKTIIVVHLRLTFEFGRFPLENPSSIASNFDSELLQDQLTALRIFSLPSTP